VLSSMPTTPDRTKALVAGGESPVEALVRSAGRLGDADFAVIPCNNAHAFLDDVRERVAIPFVDMVRVSVERAVSELHRRGTIGILAASGTLAAAVYPKWIQKMAPEIRSLSLLDLDDGRELQERLVMEPIFAPHGIKAGAFRDPDRREQLAEPMRVATRKLAEAGADVVLTACTEIPLVLGRERVDDIPLLDPMAVAAERCIDIALGREPLPS
jgi:aspartate racemase